jgi:conjugal transfer mating pair stabilization protein TraG
MTCQQAWSAINTYLSSPTHLEENLKGVCAQVGYNTSDVPSYQKCKTDLQATFQDLGVSGVTTDDFMRQAYLSQRLHDVFRSGDTAAVANYKFLTGASGSMKAANEWLPVMKGVLTAIALGLVPFLALFIPTPLFGKALSVMLGFFIWLASWGVTDALLHQFLMDYGSKVLEGLRLHSGGSGLGMDAFYFAPGELVKVLGMFGTVRMSGLMLATVMTGILVKFGGHALATLAGNLTGQIQAAGQQAANSTEDPSGRAAALKSNAWAMPTETIANQPRYGFGGMMDEGMVNQVRGVEGAAAVRQNIGNLQQAGQMATAMSGMGELGHYMRRSQMGGAIQTDQGTLSFGGTENGLATSGLRGGHTTATTLGGGWKLDANAEKDEFGNVLAQNRTLSSEAVGKIHHLTGQDGQERWRIEAAGMGAKFGKAYQEVAIDKGAHSLSAGENWHQMWQEVEKDAITSGEARSFKEGLSNAISDSVTQKVADGSAFRQVSDETRSNFVEAAGSVGFDVFGIVKAGVGGGYKVVGSNGKSASFSASEEEVAALQEDVRSIREEALVRTMQTSAGRDYAASAAAQNNAAEGWSYLREAATRDTTSTEQNMELMTAYAMDRARWQHGVVDEQSVMAVLDDMAAARSGSGQQQNALNKEIEGWLGERYKLLDTGKDGNWVLRDKAAILNRVTGMLEPRRDAGEGAAERAKAAVADNTFDDPRPGDLRAPTDTVEERREARRMGVEHMYDDDGTYDMTSNAFKRLGREIGRPMIPTPRAPDVREWSRKPGESLKPVDSAERVNSLSPVESEKMTNSITPLSTYGGPYDVRGISYSPPKPPETPKTDKEAFARLEEKLRKLDEY